MKLRPARVDDCARIAALYRISSDGVADYIWTTLARPGQDILDVGRQRYERENSAFSYRNCTIAEVDGAVARRPIVPHPLIHCTGDAILMVKETG